MNDPNERRPGQRARADRDRPNRTDDANRRDALWRSMTHRTPLSAMHCGIRRIVIS